jgi:hypothetical protein
MDEGPQFSLLEILKFTNGINIFGNPAAALGYGQTALTHQANEKTYSFIYHIRFRFCQSYSLQVLKFLPHQHF